MQDSTSPPRPEHMSPWRNPLLLPALVLIGSLIIGLGLFLALWHIPGIRDGVTHAILAVPRPVWYLIVINIVIAAIISVWVLLRPYVKHEEEEAAVVPPSRSPATVVPPSPTPPVPTEPQVALPAAHISPVPRPQTMVIDPTTPIPEATPHLEQILQRPEIVREPGQAVVPAAAVPPVTISEAGEKVPVRAVQPGTLLSITLLKEVTLTLHLPGNLGTRQIPVNPVTKRAQLLAYLAVRRGELVHRDKILYHIFAWRREDGTTDDETMSNLFHSHTRLLRIDIRKVIQQVNTEAGEQILDPNLDPFEANTEHWGLSPICEVVDIEEVERQHKVIEMARKDGILSTQIPLFVKEACDRLIAAYPGDFIEELIKKSPKDFKPWDGKASWAKRYTTHFRSCLLDALWLLGIYEEQQAQGCAAARDTLLKEGAADADLQAKLQHLLEAQTLAAIEKRANGDSQVWSDLVLEELEQQQRTSYGRAIGPFKRYALSACATPYYNGSVFDEKVSFNQTIGRFGDRIIASEQALRRCLKACAFNGDTREATQVYSSYEQQMTTLLRTWGRTWSPSQETIDEMESVRALTDAHRFSAQIASKQAG